MIKTYIYDDSFSSLLVLIFNLIKLKVNNFDIKSHADYIPTLLDYKVYPNFDNSDKVLLYVYKNIDKKIIKIIYNVYLSTDKNKEMIIYDFFKHYLIYKNNVFRYRNIDSINKVIKISRYVMHENHKWKGFLRFKKMKNDFYYAEMNPTNNIIYILPIHFVRRLKNEFFIIKDVNRKIYALYDKNRVYYLNSEDVIKLNLDIDLEEEKFQDLWKNFFNTIGIKERKNLKCQANFMPKKYRDYILEMEDKK